MNDLHIGKLTIMGTGTKKANVMKRAAKAGLIFARGKTTADWLTAMGVDGVLQVNLQNPLGTSAADWFEQMRAFFTAAGQVDTVLYVTPVLPLNLDMAAGELARSSRSVERVTGSELSSVTLPKGAEQLAGALQSLDILRVHGAHYPIFSPVLPVLLHSAGVDLKSGELFRMLLQVYPVDHMIYVTGGLPGLSEEWRGIRLAALQQHAPGFNAIFIPPCAADASLESFMQVIAQLRAPDGCPWDRKQTHASLRQYLLEETYEALERLDLNDMDGLKEELGDLLLQIALHSQIASETGTFTITQVLQSINRKIVSRHPHVFGVVSVKDDKDVVQNWEKIKEIERAGNGKVEKNGLLDGIPQILPALSQAQSLQERAARVGFDWPEIAPVLAKVLEEMQEVSEATDERERAQELGDLLFAVVNLVRWYKVDAESALRGTNTKFRKRFAYIEKEAKEASRELGEMTLEEMDAKWEASKEFDEE